MENVCFGRIAVVGNGPLSKANRNELNSFDCVVRFNDLKNMKQGDALTVHAIRHVDRGKNSFLPGLEKTVKNSHVLPIIQRSKLMQKFPANALPPLYVDENGIDRQLEIFEKCENGVQYHHSLTRSGPSTGSLVISYLNKASSTKSIDVYGMNWNGGDFHLDFKDPTIVARCCNKCTIHPTHSQRYLPEKTSWKKMFTNLHGV